MNENRMSPFQFEKSFRTLLIDSKYFAKVICRKDSSIFRLSDWSFSLWIYSEGTISDEVVILTQLIHMTSNIYESERLWKWWMQRGPSVHCLVTLILKYTSDSSFFSWFAYCYSTRMFMTQSLQIDLYPFHFEWYNHFDGRMAMILSWVR